MFLNTSRRKCKILLQCEKLRCTYTICHIENNIFSTFSCIPFSFNFNNSLLPMLFYFNYLCGIKFLELNFQFPVCAKMTRLLQMALVNSNFHLFAFEKDLKRPTKDLKMIKNIILRHWECIRLFKNLHIFITYKL